MIKIKAEQKYITLILLIVFMAICITAFFVYLYFLEVDIPKSVCFQLSGFLFVFIYFIISAIANKSEYVSSIVISYDYIEIIYKKGIIGTRKEIVLKNDIELFYAVSTINKSGTNMFSYAVCNTVVTIDLKDKKQIQFMVDSTMSLRGCSYQFILDLIKSSREITNFKYEVCGNDSFAKKDIENYRIYGKHLSAVDQMNHDFNKMPNHVKGFIIFSIIICLWIVFLYWLYIYVL